MAQIKQVGIGRKSSGTIDGITYYVRGGVTYARSTPNMPASVYNTPEAKLRQAIFKMVQMHTLLRRSGRHHHRCRASYQRLRCRASHLYQGRLQERL